jgi:ketosteroid isomerase-like protein
MSGSTSLCAFSAIWRAYGEGRLERALDLVDPACEVIMLDGRRTYHGHDGLRQWLADVRRRWRTLTVTYERVQEPHADVVVGAGRVVAASADGSPGLDGPLACVAEFRHGRLVHGRAFVHLDDALRYAESRRRRVEAHALDQS